MPELQRASETACVLHLGCLAILNHLMFVMPASTWAGLPIGDVRGMPHTTSPRSQTLARGALIAMKCGMYDFW